MLFRIPYIWIQRIPGLRLNQIRLEQKGGCGRRSLIWIPSLALVMNRMLERLSGLGKRKKEAGGPLRFYTRNNGLKQRKKEKHLWIPIFCSELLSFFLSFFFRFPSFPRFQLSSSFIRYLVPFDTHSPFLLPLPSSSDKKKTRNSFFMTVFSSSFFPPFKTIFNVIKSIAEMFAC